MTLYPEIVPAMNLLLQYMLGVALIALQCNALLQDNKTYFMIDEELFSYKFSCASGKIVALSLDKKLLLIYDVEKQQPNPIRVSLPLPGQLLQISADGKQVAVAHDAYISTVQKNIGEDYSVKTYQIAVIETSSMVIIEKLVCLISSFDVVVGNVICLNTDNGKISTCNTQVDGGSLAFLNTVKNWVYAF